MALSVGGEVIDAVLPRGPGPRSIHCGARIVTDPFGLYGVALHQAVHGRDGQLDMLDPAGRTVGRLDAAEWTAGLRRGDRAMLDRCRGPTLDVGCGPGRLAAALTREGRSALGVDICPEAVRQTQRRGAPAWHGNVFGELPQEGSWSSVLLADGNIGVRGRPPRFAHRRGARRCPGGTLPARRRRPGTATRA